MLLVYGTWHIYTLAWVCALLRVPIPFIATPKTRQSGNYLGLIVPQIIVVALLVLGSAVCLTRGVTASDWVVIGFALLNVALHVGAFYAVWEGIAALDIDGITRTIPCG